MGSCLSYCYFSGEVVDQRSFSITHAGYPTMGNLPLEITQAGYPTMGDLPLEILSKILDELDYVSRRRSMRVCRLWADVIEKLPHNMIHLGLWDLWLHNGLIVYQKADMKRVEHLIIRCDVNQKILWFPSYGNQDPASILNLILRYSYPGRPPTFPRLRKLTIYELSIFYTEDRVEQLLKILPAQAAWEMRAIKIYMCSPHERMSFVTIDRVSGNGGLEGAIILGEAIDKALPALSSSEEDEIISEWPFASRPVQPIGIFRRLEEGRANVFYYKHAHHRYKYYRLSVECLRSLKPRTQHLLLYEAWLNHQARLKAQSDAFCAGGGG